ncbi:unnamed protein product [Trichobilharzia regenti]|nr:unnamed protein product [Trichobilharzia regenti]
MLVFMDHSNRTTNPVNHQTKKERSVHGKPEWQKPPEWNLPELNRKDLVKLMNERQQGEGMLVAYSYLLAGILLKRSHESSEGEVGSLKDDRPLLPSDCKRAKLSFNSESLVECNLLVSFYKNVKLPFCFPENSTLYQLVDAIRASIGGLLEQPPPSSARVAYKLSPSNNGSIFGSNRASAAFENNQPSSCQLSPIKGSQQSQLEDRLRQPCSVSISSSCRQSKCDNPIVYRGLTESRNYNVHKSSVQSANQCPVSSIKTNTMDESRHIVSSNNSPLLPYPASSQTESRSLPYETYSACRNRSHQNSPSVIPSPHTNQTTASTSSASLQTCVSLSHYDLSSRQVNKIIEILAEQAHCKTTTKEPNCSSDFSINSNKLHDDLKAATSPVNSARAFISRTLQNEYAYWHKPVHVLIPAVGSPEVIVKFMRLESCMSAGGAGWDFKPCNWEPNFGHLLELRDGSVLKAALHHHSSSHSAADSTSVVLGNDIQNSCSRSDSLVHHDNNKSHNLDFKG